MGDLFSRAVTDESRLFLLNEHSRPGADDGLRSFCLCWGMKSLDFQAMFQKNENEKVTVDKKA